MRKSALIAIVLMVISCVTNATVKTAEKSDFENWPVLKRYDLEHIARIALPLGGIGTGTVSLGGRGDLRDWEIMNRPAKGFVPISSKNSSTGPFFALYTKTAKGKTVALALEGPINVSAYEASHGSRMVNHGMPRFRNCSFAAAYPLGQVYLSDPDVPVDVHLKAFNPLVPADADASGIPIAVLKYVLRNKTDEAITASVCAAIPNFIGNDGFSKAKDWKGDPITTGSKANKNEFRKSGDFQGIFMTSEGVEPNAEQWGTIALATTATEVTYRTAWARKGWGASLLDFWDDFSTDGKLQQRQQSKQDNSPTASLAATIELPAKAAKEITFLLSWHFPNRNTWTPKQNVCFSENRVGNYYTTKYTDSWDVLEKTVPELDKLEKKTVEFVRTFCRSDLPEVVKESALFNISTLRTQTCFRTADGLFFGWEGCSTSRGCCYGSCTHVWNYEQATAFLFGSLAQSMRQVEFGHATRDDGLMSFRVKLPIERAQERALAAADGQLGCIMKVYRDWQLSGDDKMLKELWPNIKRAVEFCWIKGGWDSNKDGVMEGCQHNTMDVEYYGPNPQMQAWYLGALRAANKMAAYVGDTSFAHICGKLADSGSEWMDNNLFNGEYYEHQIITPKSQEDIAKPLRTGMGAKDLARPDYQLGKGCLVDQLVGQYMAHVCDLGYLVKAENVQKTLKSIMKYNYREDMYRHFNCMRSFAMGDESVLLMASYPKERPKNPFPYFTEVMTGFEYVAAIGMLYEGQTEDGLLCIKNIRDRYDGQKRSPFDEAECGHHYARAMASWASVLALTGFNYSGVDKEMKFAPKQGEFFWSNGWAWGSCSIRKKAKDFQVELSVLKGELALSSFKLRGFGQHKFDKTVEIKAGKSISFVVEGR